MDGSFFERPILNSPYQYPARHWELDADGQPTGRLIESRREARFITPIPRPKKHKRRAGQERLVFDEGAGVSTATQQYDPTPIINELRRRVDQWRAIGNPSHWGVTPETARLLQALAAPRVRRHPALLLPDRGCRDGDLAHGGGAERARRQGLPGAPDQRQQRRQPGADAARAQAGHRRRQDDRHGHAHRLADHQRCPALAEQAHRQVHRRVDADADARPGRAHNHPERRHHRRGRRSEPGPPGRYPDVHAALSPDPKLHLFGQLKRITREWLETHLVCKGGTYPAQLMYQELADMACNKITAAITAAFADERPIKAVLDSYNPVGSTAHVRFNTSRTHRWQTDPTRCHINWVVLDSDWEAEFCRVAESHPRVKAYVKNHNLGLEVPYRYGSETRRYLPDFIVLVDDEHGADDLLHLVVEIKGYRREDAKEKKATMDTYWVPAVNNLRTLGRWAFAELTEIYQIEADFKAKVTQEFDAMLARIGAVSTKVPT